MSTQTRQLPLQTRLAVIQPATFNAEARTVEVVWTTGASVRRYDFWSDETYDEELEISAAAIDMARFSTGAAPVLDSHATRGLENQLGVVERAWIDGNVGKATLRLSQREDVAGIVADIAAGIIRNISVGYSVQQYQITRSPGQVAVYRAVRWTPSELSFVTVPADPGATTRDAPAQGSPCLFTTRGNAMDPNDNGGIAAPAADDAANIEQQQRAQREAAEAANVRSAEIVALATRHGMTDKAEGWIRSGKPIGDIRADVLTALVAADQARGGNFNHVVPGLDAADKQRMAAEEMLLHRASAIDPSTKQRVQMARENPMRGYTLLELARASLERAGVNTQGMDKLTLVGRAFTQSTSDFPVLLENTMHKALQGAYAVAADTWSRFCARGSVSDFRAHNRYRTGSIGNLDSLTELGEFKHKAIGDGEKATITAATKGNIVTLSRQAIINDDLSAFVGVLNQLGRAAARTIEADVYTLLAANPTLEDGVALFHASHGNIGTGGAPSVTSFDNARSLMAAQTDVSGNDYLDLRPSIWLGPTASGGLARVINGSQYDPDANNKLQRANAVYGLFADVIDTPRISGTTWYAFANPADAPVIEVAFLDGQDAPFLDMEEGFSVDGARWKVRLDFGIAAIDYRGAVRNAGA
jgi:hypothetical protein